MPEPDLTPVTIGDKHFHFEDYRVGQTFHSRARTITDSDIRNYLGATGTDHPNHTDAEYCKAHPLINNICVPGVLLLGVVDGLIADSVTRYMATSMNYGHNKIRYLKPVYVDDTIRAELTVTDCTARDDSWGLVQVDVTALNQRQEPVLFDSHLLIVARRAGNAS